MGNRHSTTQYEKLTENITPENINYIIHAPFKYDLVMYFDFSLNKIDYRFKIYNKSEEFEYRYKSWSYNTKATSGQRYLKTDPILKIKHLWDKNYRFEVYNLNELKLNTVVNLVVGSKTDYLGC
jgi:hypothetical protein